jgi:hypothetical protein
VWLISDEKKCWLVRREFENDFQAKPIDSTNPKIQMLPLCSCTNGTCENIEKEQDWEETFEEKKENLLPHNTYSTIYKWVGIRHK